MAKCDTGETEKKLLCDDGVRAGWCRRCYRDWLHSEDEKHGTRCEECKVIHLKERTFEKIPGWLCRSCAKKYDEALLAELVGKGGN